MSELATVLIAHPFWPTVWLLIVALPFKSLIEWARADNMERKRTAFLKRVDQLNKDNAERLEKLQASGLDNKSMGSVHVMRPFPSVKEQLGGDGFGEFGVFDSDDLPRNPRA